MNNEAKMAIYSMLRRIDLCWNLINPSIKTQQQINNLCITMEECFEKLRKIIKAERRKYEQTKNEQKVT